MRNLFLILILLTSSAYGGIVKSDSAGGTQVISTMGLSVLDTLVILPGDTVDVAATYYSSGDTTCLVLYTREGGVFTMSGSGVRANFGVVAMGGITTMAQPFSEGSVRTGGELYMGASDTLEIFSDDILALDLDEPTADLFMYGTNSVIEAIGGNSSTKAVIMRGNSTNKIFHTSWSSGQGTVNLQYAKIIGFNGTAGFILGGTTAQRTASNTTINYCVFDTCNIFIQGHGIKFESDSIYYYEGTSSSYAIQCPTNWLGALSACTLSNIYVEYDANNTSETTPQMLYLNGDSLVLDGCHFTTTDRVPTTGDGVDNIVMAGGGDDWNLLTIQNSTIDGGYHTVNKSGRVIYHTILKDNIFIGPNKSGGGNGESLLWGMNLLDTTFTAIGNHFYGSTAGAFLLEYSNADTFRCDQIFLFNTMVDCGQDFAWRMKVAGTAVQKGGTIVGNIGASGSTIYSNDVSWYMNVILDDFKYYAGDSVLVNVNCDPCSIWVGTPSDTTYDFRDSLSEDVSAFAFVDSANYDFRLAVGSPMLNAGDSVWWVSAFTPTDSSTAPGNLGYYQGAGVSATTRPYFPGVK